ncbi:DNA replication factor Dna2, partial [Ostertagia ostertagi]
MKKLDVVRGCCRQQAIDTVEEVIYIVHGKFANKKNGYQKRKQLFTQIFPTGMNHPSKRSVILLTPACPQGSLVHHVAEKENSDLNDSFDDPVILNSGVDGFPSLTDSKSESTPHSCEVKNEEGLVDLLCVTDNGQQSIVYLQDHWAETNVEPNTRISVSLHWDWLVSNEHGVMIVAPDTLVPCTSIAGATWCPRKVILNERFRGPVEANKAMLIGNIVHEMFQAALRCPTPRTVSRDWLLHIWRANIRSEVLAQLVALRFTPSQFETELEPYLEVSIFFL